MGVQMVVTIWRKDGMSREEFIDYWTKIHAPKLMNSVPALKKYVTKYTQHPLKSVETTSSEEPDGVAVFTADSKEDLDMVFQSKEFFEHVAPDNENYVKEMKTIILSDDEMVTVYERDPK
ncbi:hypothetical protein BP6252_09770 [Coleophoma cylindrospora]|uniref:EthD domain-containing protein n=1 Tax=Coleophoma cylindrospora TaxID=1849047 RepID=A0A3D8QWI4_9HELO|nr:hypothetical protein BP6252_09770 [Coleophoma cylindrospora]